MKIFPLNFDQKLKHEYCSLSEPLLTLSYSSEISIMLLVYPQRVMLQLKNAMIYSQRATLLIQLGTTVIWPTLKKFKLAGSDVEVPADYNGCLVCFKL
jgi:hypothetical protein